MRLNAFKLSAFIAVICCFAIWIAYVLAMRQFSDYEDESAIPKEYSVVLSSTESLDVKDANVQEEQSNIVSGLENLPGYESTISERLEEAASERYVKLDAAGNVLEDNAEDWACVSDGKTGLVWEVKKDDGSWQDSEQTYTWLADASVDLEDFEIEDPNVLPNGVSDGGQCLFISCDTASYQRMANQETICAISDWRLPTEEELKSLDHPTRYSPDIYIEYFPYAQSSEYWSASQSEFDEELAWSVDFANGIGYVSKKSLRKYIRLVAAGE